jgi:hypothetical protein
MWLLGCYESERAARFAFRVTDAEKAELRDDCLKEGAGVITLDQIRAFRRKEAEKLQGGES